MKFQSLNGQEVHCEVSQSKYPTRTKDQCKSDGQFNLGQQLKLLYKGVPILEEFPIPGTKLSLDFFIPSFKAAFEFQGSQHDSFNKFFHADKKDFVKQTKRDQDKKEWCKLNAIKLIEIRKPDLTFDELKAAILEIVNG